MAGERLVGIALIYIHCNMNIDVEEFISLFALMGPRRLEFL